MRAIRNLFGKLSILILIYVGAVALGGLVFSYAESKPIFDSMWWAAVTATSVGYGDIYPSTILGRIDGIILANIVLLFIVPLLTGRYSAQMIVDSDAFTHAEQEEVKQLLLRIDARLEAIKAR